tara:strand:- start:557 stop:802 length:246 start_codon:yes stop_codon:yes gene_type:complete
MIDEFAGRHNVRIFFALLDLLREPDVVHYEIAVHENRFDNPIVRSPKLAAVAHITRFRLCRFLCHLLNRSVKCEDLQLLRV